MQTKSQQKMHCGGDLWCLLRRTNASIKIFFQLPFPGKIKNLIFIEALILQLQEQGR